MKNRYKIHTLINLKLIDNSSILLVLKDAGDIFITNPFL